MHSGYFHSDGSNAKKQNRNYTKKGNALLRKHLPPLLRGAGMPTGSAADVDSEGVDTTDPAEKLDWNKLCRVSKWPNLDVYFEHFCQHPTWGWFLAKETGENDDSDEER